MSNARERHEERRRNAWEADFRTNNRRCLALVTPAFSIGCTQLFNWVHSVAQLGACDFLNSCGNLILSVNYLVDSDKCCNFACQSQQSMKRLSVIIDTDSSY